VASHDAWTLVCRLFIGGTPLARSMLSPAEIAASNSLGKAVKAAALNQTHTLCPYCQLHRCQIWGDGKGGRCCHCPECGQVSVQADDLAALELDEEWFRAKLRLAMDINSRDGIIDLGSGVWHLGEARRDPILLVRSLINVWREPTILERVRVKGGDIRVIAPRHRETRGEPFWRGVVIPGGTIFFLRRRNHLRPGGRDSRHARGGRSDHTCLWSVLGGFPVGHVG